MAKSDNLKWKIYNKKRSMLLSWGYKHGYVDIYSDELIKKFRNIYYGGIPASILLLCDGMSNGYCYDRALLLSKAFLDTEDDVNLIYADVDGIKYDPINASGKDNPLYADHCVVERITKDGKRLIYDPSGGLVYDKRIYWLMENPKVRKINNKKSIIDFAAEEERLHPTDIEKDKYMSIMTLDMIEEGIRRNSKHELYAVPGVEMLQEEIKHFKNVIGYDDAKAFIKKDIKRLNFG